MHAWSKLNYLLIEVTYYCSSTALSSKLLFEMKFPKYILAVFGDVICRLLDAHVRRQTSKALFAHIDEIQTFFHQKGCPLGVSRFKSHPSLNSARGSQ
jgi:hypothetical protein